MFKKNKSMDQLLRAPSSVGRRNSMRADEGRKAWKGLASRDENEGTYTCAVVGRREKDDAFVTVGYL